MRCGSWLLSKRFWRRVAVSGRTSQWLLIAKEATTLYGSSLDLLFLFFLFFSLVCSSFFSPSFSCFWCILLFICICQFPVLFSLSISLTSFLSASVPLSFLFLFLFSLFFSHLYCFSLFVFCLHLSLSNFFLKFTYSYFSSFSIAQFQNFLFFSKTSFKKLIYCSGQNFIVFLDYCV